MAQRKVRILVVKPALNGHDRSAKVATQALRDAGFEVIYTGFTRRPNRSWRRQRLTTEGIDRFLEGRENRHTY